MAGNDLERQRPKALNELRCGKPAWGGLAWINDLVAQGEAVDLGGNGYPYWYTAQARHLIPRIIDEPPEAHEVWICGPEDIIGAGWAGRTVINRDAADMCSPTEWLQVVVWDES